MNANPPHSLTPRELARLLVEQRKLWIAPAIGCAVLAAMYSLVMPRYWEASQALVVRQETAGSQSPTPGKFADLYEMRTMQETILELAKSRDVVVSTINAVDLNMNGAATELTAEDVEKFRDRLKMLPPDGGEFGKTEVFYFYLQDPSRERAIELVSELCRQLDDALKELRAKRAEGLIAELEEQVALAAEIHAKQTKRLAEFEAEVGADLGELRMLHAAASGQSDLRQEVVQLEADVRRFAMALRESDQLLGMLRAAEKDPQQLLATPNSLLVSQPALRRLKDGLVDAQLATARLGGTRSADHPRVKAAVESEKEIRADLHRELLTAIRGGEAEVRLAQQRLEATRSRLKDVEGRLEQLAERRAEYSNRVAAVDNTRITLDRARQKLSTAKAAEAAARSGSLVTRIDRPETGPYPAGPGRTVVTAAGGVGGLMLGLGLLFLTVGGPPPESTRSAAPLVARRTAPPAPVEEMWPVQVTGEPIATVAAAVVAQANVTQEPPASLLVGAATPGEREYRFEAATVGPATIVQSADELPVNASVPQPVARHASTPRRESVDMPVAPKDAAAVSQVVSQSPPAKSVAPSEPTPNASAPISTAEDPVVVKPIAREPEPQPAAAAGSTAKKPFLPAAAGKLPTPAGTLPPLAAVPAVGGMSLQEALQAARQAQQ
ncbi:MAG TPA: Wzz/FepE/Etk N-terminal domain-containing protein [Lacipirellula sp.]